MTFSLHIIGTNFKCAELESVAKVQWADRDHIGAFLADLRASFSIEEAFFLQTCNRREFYFYAPALDNDSDFFSRFLDYLSASLDMVLDEEHFYHYRDSQAVRHLFRVAASLDSMVLGETEIMKQIKDQSSMARNSRNKGRRLASLVDTAIWTAKQVRHRTKITRNVVSMASLALRYVTQHLAHRSRKRVVVVGAGHFITSIMPTFTKAEDLEFVFVNRSLPTQLAEEYDGTAMTLADFIANPVAFDVMVTATAAKEPLFDAAWFAERDAGLLVLDAALPRDIAADVNDLQTVKVLDLAHMEAILAKNRAAREAEIPKTEPIFDEGMDKVVERWLECDLAAYNQEISKHFRSTGERALSHLLKKHLPPLSDEEEQALRGWTEHLVHKLTTIPILGLKGVAKEMGEDAIAAYTKNIAENTSLFKVS